VLAQCGNFTIFLSLRFYVKIILESTNCKTAIFTMSGALNLVDRANFSFQIMKKCIENQNPEPLNVLTLISRKIWVTVKFCIFHTVVGVLRHLDLVLLIFDGVFHYYHQTCIAKYRIHIKVRYIRKILDTYAYINYLHYRISWLNWIFHCLWWDDYKSARKCDKSKGNYFINQNCMEG